MGGWSTLGKALSKVSTFLVKEGYGVGKGLGKAAIRHPVAAGAAWVYMKKEDGEGILPAVAKEIFGEEKVTETGIAGGVNETVFGTHNTDKSVLENVTDLAFGEGSYKGAVQKGSDAYHAASDYARQGMSFVRDSVMPQGQPGTDVQQGQLLYDANGNVVGAYPGAGAYTYNPEQVAAMQSANPFSSMGGFVNQISGGKVTGLNALEIVAAAYMMFGRRFGWLGKIAGALIGGTAAKDITNRSAMIQQQQQMGYGVQPSYPQQQYVPQSPQQQVHQPQAQEEDYIISRGRSL